MTDLLTEPAKCPECRYPVEDHWSLVMTEEELDAWSTLTVTTPGICHRSRGEVMLMIEGVR